MAQENILLVEDNQTLGYILKEYLEMNEYKVIWAQDGKEGFRQYQENPIDLCILDVMMPEEDGFSLAQRIKNLHQTSALIFLTAKSLKIDKLKGFKLGADDYIVKPVDEEELLARVKAVLNRTKPISQTPSESLWDIGEYTFQPQKHILMYGAEEIRLSKKEADLLALLCKHKNRVLDRSQTLKELWGKDDYFNRRSMDVFISKLRKYLSRDARLGIENVHNRGFILVDKSVS